MHAYSGGGSKTSALGAIAVLAVLLAMAANWLFALQGVIPPWLLSAPTVAGFYGLLYFGLERHAWKWPAVRALGIVDTPVIEGRYEGSLVTTYNGSTRPIRLEIDQTWTRIAVRFTVMEPASSTSYSVSASLDRAGHDKSRLTYSYNNRTRPGVADNDMADHDGTAELTFEGDGTASGRYYNFRGNRGTLTVQSVN